MMRVCIIGNSHVAALRGGWGAHPGRWPLKVRFAAAPRDLLTHTQLKNGRLQPADPATASAMQATYGDLSLNLDEHDAFVIIGCALALHAILPLYRDAVWPGLKGADRQNAGDPLRQPISAPAALATAKAILSDRLALRLARLLRQGTVAPVLVCPQPRASDSLMTNPRPETRLHRKAVARGDGAAVGRLFEQAASGLLDEIDAQFLPQPAATISRHILTARQHFVGAERLVGAAPQPDDDVYHGNAGYGAQVLDQLAAALTGPAYASSSAPVRSASKSSTPSSPTDSRISPGVMPSVSF